MAVFEEPIVREDQRGEIFYDSISKTFNKWLKPGHADVHTGGAIRKRWELIMNEFSCFFNFVARVKQNKPTGVNANDMTCNGNV